jgi:Zn-dependent peptidase ImmA (M78 family)
MRATEFLAEKKSHVEFIEIFKKFLPLAMEIIGLDHLPKMVFEKSIGDEGQPTFGKYVNDEKTLYVALSNRHPNDILRTVAHELTHYRQDTEHQLDDTSGETGSPIENEANAVAGVVMRNFNKRYPQYLKVKPIIAESKIKEMIYLKSAFNVK